MAAIVSRGEVVRRIIERTDMEQFAERVLDSFWGPTSSSGSSLRATGSATGSAGTWIW